MGKICEYYSGKNVLVTGATGFCGKVLVEKLLRSCDEIGKIYILVREKKNVSPRQRYVEYIKHFIFDGVRQKDEKILEKVVLVAGDVTIDGLNLSYIDEIMLIKNVNIVFHCAGNIKFNDNLKNIINSNVTGTLRILKLAVKMNNLEAFLHISTISVQCQQQELLEKSYEPTFDVFDIIKKCQELSEVELRGLEKELLLMSTHPNTYTLSKSLGEDVVYSFRHKLPIVIVRPSLVWGAVNEPLKGYVEGIQSGLGLICGAMTGLIRSVYMNPKSTSRFTPVDYAINSAIVSAWKRSQATTDDILVYNCTDSDQYPLPWKNCFETSTKYISIYPPYKKMIWYPKTYLTTNFTWHLISMVLFQLLPAIFFDLILICAGKKPRVTKIQMQIFKGFSVLYFFFSKTFIFRTEKLQELFNELDTDDQKKFCFDHTIIDFDDYLKHGILQIRRLLLKEDDATIPLGREKYKKLSYANLLVKAFFVVIIFYYLLRFCGVI